MLSKNARRLVDFFFVDDDDNDDDNDDDDDDDNRVFIKWLSRLSGGSSSILMSE